MGYEPDQAISFLKHMPKILENITQSKILSEALKKLAKRVKARAFLSLKLCQSNQVFFSDKNIQFSNPKHRGSDRSSSPEFRVRQKNRFEFLKFVCQHQWRHPRREDADLTLSGE
jgi:hypothetical protein